MLTDIVDVLADPIDGTALSLTDDGARLVSTSGHSYDVARSGYVTLAGGAGLKHGGDDAEMVAAREVFLSQGFYAPFVEAVTHGVHDALEEGEVGYDVSPVICEIGAGTGYYLAHTLDAVDDSRGVGIDVSVPAAKKLTKAHPRAGAIVADAWSRLPLRDESIDAITVVFAPRNASEFARVLKPGGQVVVLTAAPGHLGELREPLGIIDVEHGKVERLIAQAEGHLELAREPEAVEFTMTLSQPDIAAQIGMSPSARHIEPDVLQARIDKLPHEMTITARATVTRLRRTAR